MSSSRFPFLPAEPAELPKELKDGVLFFLGAGASVAAEVPDTTQFVQLFQEWLKKSFKHPEKELLNGLLDKILKRLGDGAAKRVDVELLMESLDALSTRDEGPSKLFSVEKSIGILSSEYIQELRDALKVFIKRKTLVSPEKVQYLKHLVGFSDSGPLDIFSVNYDTCIEQLCHAHRLKYTDGFELEWQPESFERADWDVRLYKLHGSVLWYESEQARYLKVPVMEDSIKLFTGETAKPLMLYPMRKWQYAEPLLELLVSLKHRLESNQKTRVVVVVGYSFRDEYIKRLFWDAFRANKDLVMVLIDPYADEIYKDRLLEYPNGVPSSMVGRVVRLSYPFEKVLPTLKHGFLKNLKTGVHALSQGRNAESRGESGSWADMLEPLLMAGHYDAFTSIREKAVFNSWAAELNIPLLAASVSASLGRTLETKRWIDEFSVTTMRLLASPSVTLGRQSNEGKLGTHMDLVFRGSRFGEIRCGELAYQIERGLTQVRFLLSLLLKEGQAKRRHLLEGIKIVLEEMLRHYRAIEQAHPIEEFYAQTFKDASEAHRTKANELAAMIKNQVSDSKDAVTPPALILAMIQMEKDFLSGALSRLNARLR